MSYPIGCGAVYDGGRMGTSRHFDAHVEKRSFKQSETSCPWYATTVTCVQNAARERLAVSPTTVELVSASNVISHCLLPFGFIRDHIIHGRVITTTAIPMPALDLITAGATDVMVKANNLLGILRVAAMDVVTIFPSLVLYPPRKELATRKCARR